MKKQSFVLILILFLSATITSQTINLNYMYNTNSGNCLEINYQVQFRSDIYTRIDLYDNSKIWSPSRIASSGYNEQDLYYEVMSPRFYLDVVGVSEYKRVPHYLIKVIYNKRGGDVLYILEQSLDSSDKQKMYYITELGKKYFCEN